jgi:hypothetical protein
MQSWVIETNMMLFVHPETGKTLVLLVSMLARGSSREEPGMFVFLLIIDNDILTEAAAFAAALHCITHPCKHAAGQGRATAIENDVCIKS